MATARWFEPDDEKDEEIDERDRAGALQQETADIESRQHAWHDLNLWNATLYSNRVQPGFRWGAEDGDDELWPDNLRTENLVEEIGGAFLSKASSSPLKPTPVPHGKSWKVERAVREVDRFMFGVWRQTEAENACVLAFLDAFQSSLGCIRTGYDEVTNTVDVTPVFFDNVIIDNRECTNRQMPRTYRIRQVVPTASIEAKYGIQLEKPKKPYVHHRQVADGWTVMIEAWRLPDAKGEGGWTMITAGGRILTESEWKHPWVPLDFMHWTDRTSGFFDKSGVEQLVPYQVRHNQLNDDIQEAQDLGCRMRILLQANSQIDDSQWDSEQGRILLWSGSKPESFTWDTNLSELYAERERNRQGAYSHMAISEMFGNADLPQQVRLDSSAGVREARNMEDSRHLRLWNRFEALRLAVAKKILLVLSIHEGADAFSSVYHPGGKASASRIPYNAVKTLTADKYSWTLEATPMASMSPAARRELIRDWTSRDLIDPAEARRMEGNPNLERIEDLEMASYDDIYRHMGILESGKYEDPTELTNLTFGIKKITQNLHRLRGCEDENGECDVPQEILDAHIDWIVAATSIQQAAIAGTQQVPQAGTAFAPTQGMPGTSAATGPKTVIYQGEQNG